jgi:hypothetical protein
MPVDQVKPHTESGHGRSLTTSLVISVIGVVISILFVILMRRDGIRKDEAYYFTLAQRIIGGSYDDTYIIRPPIYPLFLAAVLKIFGAALKPALLVQSVVRGGLIFLTSFVGMKQGFALAGLVTASLIAIYPESIYVYSKFLSEVVYLPIFLLSYYLLEQAIRTERRRDMIAAGAGLGAAVLVRSVSLFLGIFLAGWIVVRRSGAGRCSRRNLLSALLLLVAMFVVVAPWTVRNAVVHRGFILTGTSGAFNLYLLTSDMPYLKTMNQWSSWGTQPERQSEALRRWRAHLRQDPAFHLKQVVMRLKEGKVTFPALLAQPQWRKPAEPEQEGQGIDTSFRYNEAFARIWDTVSTGWAWVVLVLGILGLAKFEEGRRRDLMVAILVFLFLFHMTTVAKHRLFIPLSVLLAIPAGKVLALVFRRLRPTG